MLFVTIVLDGVGIGAQPDATVYGDNGSDTLGHVLAAEQPALPTLAALGLGCIRDLVGVSCPARPQARYGRMREVSAGKDSTTGHWELAGFRLDTPFPTYDEGFPDEVIDAFLGATGCGDVLGNKPASGTAIIAELGPAHEETGHPIVYTSADSVFQIAAHKDVIPLERLYAWCELARTEACVGALPRPPLQQVLQQAGVHTISIGKIADLFDKVGFDVMQKTKTNPAGIDATLHTIRERGALDEPTFVWTNLVDFDQEYGHRNDPAGFAAALEALDAALPDMLEALPDDAVLVLTADHGNDPTFPGTDHTREYVPLLVVGGSATPRNLGLRPSFNDHAATVADYFGVAFETEGRSFL